MVSLDELAFGNIASALQLVPTGLSSQIIALPRLTIQNP
jgi:hypothetical protein